MPKKIMKAMKQIWQEPKRGKRRVQRRPAGKKYVKVPYVRHGDPTTKNRVANQRWGVSLSGILSLSGLRLINMLKKAHILPEWRGQTCPRCGKGKMGALQYMKTHKVWAHRCNYWECHKFLQPHDFHPIFYMGAGNSHTPLQVQASILLCATAGVKETATHLVLDVGKKPVETIYTNLEVARSRYVEAKEKEISYGGWRDVEVDEVDVGRFIDLSVRDTKNTSWEQWVKKRDWVPIANKYLKNKNVVLHSDGARAYKITFPGVIHCNVAHKKKKQMVNGKAEYTTFLFMFN